MEKIDEIIPIFYVRGYDSPYTEGHIEIVRCMVRSLLSKSIKSLIFNYKYKTYDENLNYGVEDRTLPLTKFEQNIPLIDREELFHENRRSKVVYATLMETVLSLKFLLKERYMSRYCHCIVNMVNCFRYPRFLLKKFSPFPVVLQLFARKTAKRETTKMLIDKADVIVASSKSLAYYLQRKYNVDSPKIQTVYPPLDVDFYKPLDKGRSRSKLGLTKSDKVILYIGNLRKQRFPEDIILGLMNKLLETDSKTKLLVFSPQVKGNSERKTEIRAKANSLNLGQNVTINIRNLSEVEKKIIYSASDIFLFPPVESGEAVEPPLTVLEAISTGLPVVSSDVASIREVITDEVNGLIMPFRNDKLSFLAERISSLLEHDDERMKLSYNARQNVMEKLSPHNTCNRLIEIYRNLLD